MTLANVVTLVRLLLVPLVVFLYLKGHRVAAASVFAFAALTDVLDGWLARTRGEVSGTGKWLDPVADKALQISGLLLVSLQGFIPMWLVVLLLAKEAALLIGGALLLRRDVVISARFSGKAASFLLFSGLVAGLADVTALRPLLYAGAIFSLLAGLDYLVLVVRASSSSNSIG